MFVLTNKVRILTLSQVARLSFDHVKHPRTSARQWLKRQANEDLVTLHEMMIHPEIDVTVPLLDYQPGNPTPDFEAIAWRAQSRWQDPVRPTLIAAATRKAKLRRGGLVGGRPIRIREATHDVHCASVYLSLRNSNEELAERWMPEDALPHSDGDRLPDAIITGEEPIVIDFVGAYAAKKLRQFHNEFQSMRYRFY